MKKVIAMVMCVAMIACIAMTASAATEVTFTIATVEGKAGDVVAIDVSVSEESNIGALELQLAYDDTQLEVVTTKNKKGQDVYFIAGDASTAAGALVEGSDGGNPMLLTAATTNGYWDAGVIATIYVKLLEDVAEGEVAAITGEVTVIQDCEDTSVQYDATVVPGGVKAPVEEVPSEPVGPSSDVTPTEPTEPSKPAEDDKKPTENPKTGDASAVAVAAGLCAVMAAAFVITKKVND